MQVNSPFTANTILIIVFLSTAKSKRERERQRPKAKPFVIYFDRSLISDKDVVVIITETNKANDLIAFFYGCHNLRTTITKRRRRGKQQPHCHRSCSQIFVNELSLLHCLIICNTLNSFMFFVFVRLGDKRKINIECDPVYKMWSTNDTK